MIPELGLLALILSMVLAAYQTVLGFALWAQPVAARLGYQKRLFRWQLALLLIAFIVLIGVFIVNDFTVVSVNQHSHIDLPWYYRVAASWGGHEGSMLLWVVVLGFWQGVVAFGRGLAPPLRVLMMAILAAISSAMTAFIVFTSNPFAREFSLLERAGQGLNPLLHDPGLMLHPPILYMGYVGSALAFALAVAVLLQGDYPRAAFAWLHRWYLLSWAFLTAGITLGSWWAYRMLGWGGWWFWDPVENASFLPWLAGTALIHALVMVRKHGAFVVWTCFLCISVFALSLLGTFLVRSGVLTSVHAFASAPQRGLVLLVLFAVVVGAGMLCLVYRVGHWPRSLPGRFLSRPFYLCLNSVILFCLMLAVLAGTLYPLFIDLYQGIQLSVGAPYFNLIFTPVALFILVLMAGAWIGPANRRLACWGIPACVLVSWGVSQRLLQEGMWPWLLFFALSLTLWVFWVTVVTFHQAKADKRRGGLSLGTLLSHSGVVLLALGVMLSSSFSVHRDVRMRIGDSVEVGAYRVLLTSMKGRVGAGFQAMQLHFTITSSKTGRWVANTMAQKRLYLAQNTLVSQPGIAAGLWRDFYIAIGEALPPDAWTLRLYYKPFVRWIWLGGCLMLAGALVSFIRARVACAQQQESRA